MSTGQPPRTPPSVSQKLTARGYSDVTVTGDAIPHPKAVMGADAAADQGGPWIARDGETGRRVPPHDARSGLDKAYAAARPVGGKPNGGGVRNLGDVANASPAANGSGAAPRKAE